MNHKNITRRSACTGFLIGGFLLAFSSIALAQDLARTYGNWKYSCKQGECVIKQGLKDNARPEIIYGSQFQLMREGNNTSMTLLFPLGIYLPPGVGLKVGNEARDVPMAVCLPRGCEALIVPDPALLDALRNEKSFKVRFYTFTNTPAEIEFSLDGFTEAYEAMLSGK